MFGDAIQGTQKKPTETLKSNIKIKSILLLYSKGTANMNHRVQNHKR